MNQKQDLDLKIFDHGNTESRKLILPILNTFFLCFRFSVLQWLENLL